MTHQYSDYIQQLLDGELDSIHESPFFGELAVNADLRSEFKQQLALRSAVHDDRAILIPPASLTNSLFSGLGFAAPLAGAAAGAAGGGLLLQWLSRFGLPILASLGAAGIAITAHQTVNNSQPAQASTVQQTNTQTALVQEVPPSLGTPPAQTTSAIPGIRSNRESLDADRNAFLMNENSKLLAEIDRLNEELRAATIAQTQSVAPIAESATTPPTEEPATQETASFNTPVLATPITLTNTYQVALTEQHEAYSVAQLNTYGVLHVYPSFMLQIRGYAPTALTNATAPAQSHWYHNLGVALQYELNNQHTVGVEFGSETFPQVFEGTRSGQIIRYDQQPSAMWAGLMYRYTMDPISKTSFSPFVQGFAGGSTYGPLGRAIVGIHYEPVGALSFIFGLEGTAMAYQFQDQWYTSNKIGLTYGMAVRF